MLNNTLVYKFYYGWWKNLDKIIFLLVIFQIIRIYIEISPNSYSKIIKGDIDLTKPIGYWTIDDESS